MYKHLNQEHYGEHWMQLRVQSSSPPWPVHAWTPSNKMSNTSKISKENTLTSNISEKNHIVDRRTKSENPGKEEIDLPSFLNLNWKKY